MKNNKYFIDYTSSDNTDYRVYFSIDEQNVFDKDTNRIWHETDNLQISHVIEIDTDELVTVSKRFEIELEELIMRKEQFEWMEVTEFETAM